VRADRLVALLLLLQSRGHVTAAEVATELEISERTARRDLEALGMAGLPVYSRQGRGGGWQLLDGGRTDLSGLNTAEVRALFLVAGPSSSVSPDVKAALRKLVRALPEPFRTDAEAASTAVVVDPTGWGSSRPPAASAPMHLDALQQAVVHGEQVVLGYADRQGASSRRTIHPLGLAAKGSTWYVIADTDAGQRTFRVDRVVSVTPTGDRVVRPDGFDLDAAWRQVTEEVGRRWATGFVARGTADPDTVRLLRMVMGRRVRIGPAGPDGRVPIEVGSGSEQALAGELAGFGGLVEITDPPSTRRLLAQLGDELRATYGPAEPGG
jgi:predicted DNA-binding transcriptional regulator YafY